MLSGSKSAWLNYDDDKLARWLVMQEAAKRGTREHAFAAEAIRLGHKLRHSKKTLNMYINDCISYRMEPELPLAYSENCFGTPDAIGWKEHADGRKYLRISDLKTGVSHASIKQLMFYAAVFFLEYGMDLGVKPNDVIVELRIYQHDEVELVIADPVELMTMMERIKYVDKFITLQRKEFQL